MAKIFPNPYDVSSKVRAAISVGVGELEARVGRSADLTEIVSQTYASINSQGSALGRALGAAREIGDLVTAHQRTPELRSDELHSGTDTRNVAILGATYKDAHAELARAAQRPMSLANAKSKLRIEVARVVYQAVEASVPRRIFGQIEAANVKVEDLRERAKARSARNELRGEFAWGGYDRER